MIAGIVIPAMPAMMAMTTNSSISVKPRARDGAAMDREGMTRGLDRRVSV